CTRRAARRALPFRPRERRTASVGGIGGGEHQRAGRFVIAQRSKALHAARQGELSTAEPFDEVAAARRAERLEVHELAVERGEAARYALGEDGLARDDAVALEQQLRERAHARPIRGSVREQGRRERPAALDLWRRRPAPAREAAAAIAFRLGQ